MHKDFIVCYFNGRSPPFHQIQSVLNHMWGKGKRLEIHKNPLNHSAIVRITSDYQRQKILEKYIWYIGDSMFHTAQWAASHSSTTPILSSIKIWAHLTGVPLDLRHQQGLSLVAGLVGDPRETNDFTLNLVSLTLSHVKVEVDLTKQLPKVVEFSRQSGEVVEVQVDYPWLPATCSHCQELGHVVRNCLKVPPAPVPTANKQKGKGLATPAKKPSEPSQTKHYVAKKQQVPASASKDASCSSTPKKNSTSKSSFVPPTPTFLTPISVSKPVKDPTKIHSLPQSPSDKPRKPSLKRTYSSPSLSPPQNSIDSTKTSNQTHISPFLHEGLDAFISDTPNFNPNSFIPFSVLTTSPHLQPA